MAALGNPEYTRHFLTNWYRVAQTMGLSSEQPQVVNQIKSYIGSSSASSGKQDVFQEWKTNSLAAYVQLYQNISHLRFIFVGSLSALSYWIKTKYLWVQDLDTFVVLETYIANIVNEMILAYNNQPTRNITSVMDSAGHDAWIPFIEEQVALVPNVELTFALREYILAHLDSWFWRVIDESNNQPWSFKIFKQVSWKMTKQEVYQPHILRQMVQTAVAYLQQPMVHDLVVTWDQTLDVLNSIGKDFLPNSVPLDNSFTYPNVKFFFRAMNHAGFTFQTNYFPSPCSFIPLLYEWAYSPNPPILPSLLDLPYVMNLSESQLAVFQLLNQMDLPWEILNAFAGESIGSQECQAATSFINEIHSIVTKINQDRKDASIYHEQSFRHALQQSSFLIQEHLMTYPYARIASTDFYDTLTKWMQWRPTNVTKEIQYRRDLTLHMQHYFQILIKRMFDRLAIRKIDEDIGLGLGSIIVYGSPFLSLQDVNAAKVSQSQSLLLQSKHIGPLQPLPVQIKPAHGIRPSRHRVGPLGACQFCEHHRIKCDNQIICYQCKARDIPCIRKDPLERFADRLQPPKIVHDDS